MPINNPALDPVPPRFNLARHCLAENARLRPQKPGMIVVGEGLVADVWSFSALDLAVRKLAAGLKTLDLPPRSRIMIRMGNEIDYVLMFLAANAAGHIPIPSSSQLTVEEADFILADSGAVLLVVGADFARETHSAAHVRIIGPQEIEALKQADPIDYADTAADDPAYLIYTSGTTSRPKGVLHAQRVMWGRRPMYDHWIGHSEHDIMLHAGAMNWTYTLGVGIMDPWARGATAIIYNGERDPGVWPVLIERYKATIFAAVPGVYRQILKYGDLAQHDLTSLRHGLTAGEALAPALYDEWCARMRLPLYEALGMSEISTYISSGPTTPVRTGSPGRPQPGRRVAILPVEEGETPLPAGQTGLLAVHRTDPALMLGYWNRPDEEADAMRGDWFIGGDLAELDSDGYLWFHGRNDDIMNAFGYRVSPAEVDACIAHIPGVADVAVTEKHVRADLTIIAAFVVMQPGAAKDEKAILAHCEEHLASYKRPRRVEFIDSIPRTRNGKVSRRMLPDLS